MDNFIQREKHIFTEKVLEEIDIYVTRICMVASNESIFVFGGEDGGILTSSVEVRRYDLSDQKWHKLKEMPHYVWGATAQIVDDKIFIMGRGYKSYNLVYDINSNSWEEKASIPISRKQLVSGVIDGIIYITGGYQISQIVASCPYCYAYDPKTDNWKECKRALYYRISAMSVVIDNFLYVLGGLLVGSDEKNIRKMERYSPEDDLWEAMPEMPRNRSGSVAVAIDSKIFVLCGMSYEKDEKRWVDYITMDYYDTRTRKWTISGISTPQIRNSGVAMIDNKIYLTAGSTSMSESNRNLYEITYGGMQE